MSEGGKGRGEIIIEDIGIDFYFFLSPSVRRSIGFYCLECYIHDEMQICKNAELPSISGIKISNREA